MTIGPTGCAWNSKDVTTPKLLPAPRTAPEEILVLGRACPAELAVGGDDVDRDQIVDRQPVLTAQMTHAAVERQTGDACGRDDSAGHREPEELRLPVGVAPGRAPLRPHCLRRRVDMDTAHPRQIDDEPAVVHRVAGHVVTAGFDREDQILVAREADRIDNVRGPAALHDHRGAAVDEPVPNRAGIVVSLIAGAQNRAPNTFHEPLNRFRIEHHVSRQRACHRFLLGK